MECLHDDVVWAFSTTPARSVHAWSHLRKCSYKEWTKDDDRTWEKLEYELNWCFIFFSSFTPRLIQQWFVVMRCKDTQPKQKFLLIFRFGENLWEFVLVMTGRKGEIAERQLSMKHPTNYHAKVIDRKCLFHFSVAVELKSRLNRNMSSE